MEIFRIMIPVPSMGATVYELTVVELTVAPGAMVKKGQKLAVFESDKSTFDFESPADGTVLEIHGRAGDVLKANSPFVGMETKDATLRHLQVADKAAPTASPVASAVAKPASAATWTPRAVKIAADAGLDPAKITDIEATGPGGRISGDDVTRYLATRKG